MIEFDDNTEIDNYNPTECINAEDAQLVLEPRDTLTEDEKELADMHVSCCLSCRMDMEFEWLMDRIDEENSRS